MVGTRQIIIYVGLLSGDMRAIRWLVALNVDFRNYGIVIAVGLDVLTIPVDWATGPLNSTGGIRRRSARPDRKLDTARRLRKVIAIRCRVPGVTTLDSTSDLSIDGPLNLIGCPVDGVSMIIVECIRERDVRAVQVCEGVRIDT